MKMGRVVEKVMDAGFDPAIRKLMDDDVHEMLVEKALDGDQAAQVRYIERFLGVVGEIDGELRRDLVRKVTFLGAEDGVEEFLEEVSDRVVLFENEVIDLLRESPPMEEAIEIEIEDETQTDEMVFRVWNPGGGAEPVAEFTVLDPEARADFIREGIHDVIAASWIKDMRGIVEGVLHDLKRKEVK